MRVVLSLLFVRFNVFFDTHEIDTHKFNAQGRSIQMISYICTTLTLTVATAAAEAPAAVAAAIEATATATVYTCLIK